MLVYLSVSLSLSSHPANYLIISVSQTSDASLFLVIIDLCVCDSSFSLFVFLAYVSHCIFVFSHLDFSFVILPSKNMLTKTEKDWSNHRLVHPLFFHSLVACVDLESECACDLRRGNKPNIYSCICIFRLSFDLFLRQFCFFYSDLVRRGKSKLHVCKALIECVWCYDCEWLGDDSCLCFSSCDLLKETENQLTSLWHRISIIH